MSEEDAAPPSPAEERLGEHLALLRAEKTESNTSLVRRIVRTARWQRAVRGPIQAAASIVGAVVDGLRVLATRRRRTP